MADAEGRPIAFALTPGNVADITMAIPILEGIARPKRLIADKAYDADKLRAWLKARRIKPVIPSTASRNTPYPLDRAAYRRRNVIERMFGRLKKAQDRDPLRPLSPELPRSHRARFYRHRLDLNESPT